MRKLLVPVAAALFLAGCAGWKNCRRSETTKVDDYFAAPRHKLMVKVDALDQSRARIQCRYTVLFTGNTDSNDRSFESMTPFVEVRDLRAIIEPIRERYRQLSPAEKEKFRSLLVAGSPFFSLRCQCQDPVGLEGKIYFDGKEVAGEAANARYGELNLIYALSLKDIVGE